MTQPNYIGVICQADASLVYGIKPEVWIRVGPDPRAELQVDPAQGLGRPGALLSYKPNWNTDPPKEGPKGVDILGKTTQPKPSALVRWISQRPSVFGL